VAVDQPFFLDPGLDPVGIVKVEAFDVVDIVAVQEGMGIFRRLDRHAVARQHVEMRGAGEGLDRGLTRLQRRLDQAPFAPAAFHPPPAAKTTEGFSASALRICRNRRGERRRNGWR
jgi:hypothetical protein